MLYDLYNSEFFFFTHLDYSKIGLHKLLDNTFSLPVIL